MTADLGWLFITSLAVLALVPNLASLIQGVRLGGHVRRSVRTRFGAFLPPAIVLLPVRGSDEGFDENLRAILRQSYPAFRILVVVDESGDPAATRARHLASEVPRVPFDVVLAQPAGIPGKVNALRSALAHLRAVDEAVVFADSDIRPATDWLRQLVQPLADPTVGVATGFRWYVPPKPSFWSAVRAEWNAVSANVLFDPRRAFAWGGSCALRRETLDALHLQDRWRGVLSDDLVLTQAVRESGRSIAYVPTALVPTFEGGTRATCLEWCLRQMTMATLYHPIVRRYAAAAFAVFIGAIVLGLLTLIAAALLGPHYLVPAGLLFAPIPGAVAKASLRRRALFSAAPDVARAWRVPSWKAALAAVAVPWIMAWGLARTRRPKVVRWRGRAYDVRNPHEVRLIDGGTTGRP